MLFNINNSNFNHRLVQFPHILLSKIINFIDCDLDRICFSFVCRKWFNDRDHYLVFKDHKPNSTPKLQSVESIWEFHFYSFKTQFKYSRNIKEGSSIINTLNGASLYIVDQNTPLIDDRYLNDYFLNYETISKSKNNIYIPKSVTTLYIYIDINFLKSIYNAISESNVTSIKFCNFTQTIVPGSIPSNIKSIHFENYFNSFEKNALPPFLESLTLAKTYRGSLRPGVLPPTLTYLNAGGFNRDLEIGSLPPKLKTLILSKKYRREIARDFLPDTLENIVNFPILYISQLPNSVKTISLKTTSKSDYLHHGDIPTSITSLTFGRYPKHLDLAIVPPSVKYLKLGEVSKDPRFLNLPPTVEELDLGQTKFRKLKVQALSSIKKITLSNVNDPSLVCKHKYPPGVESMTIKSIRKIPFSTSFVPFTVKYLDMKDLEPGAIVNSSSIPSSVEELTISNNFFKNYTNRIELIPTTVKTIRMILKRSEKTPIVYEIRRLSDDQFIILADSTSIHGVYLLNPKTNYLCTNFLEEVNLTLL
ncbi:hypothetical protein PPL_03785 [Heterostelium album PN500]|uniref:Uncharacterized protein n=1 Tax=Heterostelium pallidum (strain ATCC 26659 / Pp 5 / PN500) TaxID=670386 RepID=D3B6N4_HETP5|nr:hypothetical protein PPL_03785 [Heterostelium album PN500]EFA83004.1 hypothetical protein PPL_03785 [Heterostelium album PN500]|eukprot:XP_020435121.1 hypothetical protein PPL_03785 [Heterostelium album PN500]